MIKFRYCQHNSGLGRSGLFYYYFLKGVWPSLTPIGRMIDVSRLCVEGVSNLQIRLIVALNKSLKKKRRKVYIVA